MYVYMYVNYVVAWSLPQHQFCVSHMFCPSSLLLFSFCVLVHECRITQMQYYDVMLCAKPDSVPACLSVSSADSQIKLVCQSVRHDSRTITVYAMEFYQSNYLNTRVQECVSACVLM